MARNAPFASFGRALASIGSRARCSIHRRCLPLTRLICTPRRPITLEIGFGDGESLAAMAAAAPERNFIGLEVHRPGVGHLLLALEQRELTNVRVLRADATTLLETGLPSACLDDGSAILP